MSKHPRWFTVTAALALLWNLAGLLAVGVNLGLSPADVAALPPPQQAALAVQPRWLPAASTLAVLGGTAGCVALLLRRRWALPLFAASLVGVLLQDLGLFAIAGAHRLLGAVPVVMQTLVLLVALGLVVLSRRAARRGWLA